MKETLTGLISGIVSGTGMGGGTILILVLSIFLGVDQHIAQATNLVFFVPTSISAIIVSIKEKLIEWKVGLVLATSGVVGAIIGAIISGKMDVKILKKILQQLSTSENIKLDKLKEKFQKNSIFI